MENVGKEQEIWVTAFDVLIALADSELIELKRELASIAVNHDIGSELVKGVQRRIADAIEKRQKAVAERERVRERMMVGTTILPGYIVEKPKRKKKEKGVVSKADQKLVTAAADISHEPPTGEDMAFTHSVLCQVGLPRKMFDGPDFMRKSGDTWVNVQSGWLDEGRGPVRQPIPYGPLPRLALAWLSTYAVRNKAREIPIGNSAGAFLALMGMDDQGARYTNLRRQMHALAACRLQLGFKGRTYNGQPVEQFDAWMTNKNTPQQALWPGIMVLSDGYYNSLIDSAVPLDNRALMALKGSALALDIYCWLAHRLHRIEGRPVILHWKSIREQFAQEYTGKDADKDFRDAFLIQLKKVLAVYPNAKVKQVTGGLLLLGSPPPIPYKGS